jgi:nucleotide-binding universal stress UspA family protein
MRGTNESGSTQRVRCSITTRRVLVPVDGSPAAVAALEHALSRFADEAITVLYVIDAGEPDGSLRERLLSEEFEEQRRIGEKTADRVLEEARWHAAGYGVEITAVTTFGNPIRRIGEYAADTGIDWIVMGTNSRSGLSRLLLGSVTEAVVRRSSVPVVIVEETDEVIETHRSEPDSTA